MKKERMMMHVALLDARGLKEVRDPLYKRVSVPYDKPWWWKMKYDKKYKPVVKFTKFNEETLTLGAIGFCLTGEAGSGKIFAEYILELPQIIWPGDTYTITFSEEQLENLKQMQIFMEK